MATVPWIPKSEKPDFTRDSLTAIALSRGLVKNFIRRKKTGPRSHDPLPLLEKVAAAIGGLDLVADRMRQGHFGHFGQETSLPGQGTIFLKIRF